MSIIFAGLQSAVHSSAWYSESEIQTKKKQKRQTNIQIYKLITSSNEKSLSLKANIFLAIPYIPCNLWNKNVFYWDKTTGNLSLS